MSYRKYVVKRRVIINLIGGTAIDGVATAKSGPLLVLKDAVLHDPAADHPQPMDGEVVIDLSRIDFIQAP